MNTDKQQYRKVMLGYRIEPEAKQVLSQLADKIGISQVQVVERAILELAEREGVRRPYDTRKSR